MTDLEALRALRDKVRAGENLGGMEFRALTRQSVNARRAHQGSLDAALALHEAVLPEWNWNITDLPEVFLEPPKELRHCGQIYAESVSSGLPARAWLIAILEALIWKAEQ